MTNLVAIGASAGGIPALKGFFEDVPERTGITFVVVMHLSPEHESSLAEVVESFCRLPVHQVRGRVKMKEDHVYVIPPNRRLMVADGHLDIAEFDQPGERRVPIDLFFRTVADAHPEALGVLLSGLGSDGVLGLIAIKERGGIILAQSPGEAEHDGMPRAAEATGLVDFILPARELGAKAVELRRTGRPWVPPSQAEALEEEGQQTVRIILRELRGRTGHDFSGYKRSTVLRRIARRMQVAHAQSLADYLAFLQSHGVVEAQALFRDLLISVTTFFRDRDAFEALRTTVIPELLQRRAPDEQVRVWVPGCATGEEAYSIAMLFVEAAESVQLRRTPQIFATDLDEEAIARARAGLYPEAIVADVSESRLRRFFSREGAYYRVGKELRSLILFSNHNLIRDPPFSRLDLISSRNLLIYLEHELQEAVLDIFTYALDEGGYLLLGSSESVGDGRNGFRAVDQKHRIYRLEAGERRLGAAPRLPLARVERRRGLAGGPAPKPPAAASDAELHRRVLERHGLPSILVDEDRAILHVSETANRYLIYPSGNPSADLLKIVRRELRLELRAALYRTLETGRPSRSGWAAVDLEGKRRSVQLHVSRARAGEEEGLVLVTFLEMDPVDEAGKAAGSEELGHRQLDEAEAEVITLRSRMQELVEESELRNEELQASNEELQSVNEEYKSTVEELETSKEELQSMNEELKTVNEELGAKIEALASAHDNVKNLMSATDVVTLFLDPKLRIKLFTPALERIFNILPVDEGRPLEHVTHTLRYDELRQDCESVLHTLQPVEREVRGESGKTYLVRVAPYTQDGPDDEAGGVVASFTDITRLRTARDELARSVDRFSALVAATAQIVWSTDPTGSVVEASRSWSAFTGQTEAESMGWGWLNAVHPEDRARVEEEWKAALWAQAPWESELRLRPRKRAGGEWRVTTVRAVPVLNEDGSVREWVGMNTDVTEYEEVRTARTAAEDANLAKAQFLSTLSHELRAPLNAIVGLADLLMSDVFGPVRGAQREPLRRIRRSAWHQHHMIEEILAFSRVEAGKEQVVPERTDVAEIVRHVMEMLELKANEKGVALRMEGVGRPVPFVTDAGKVRQIVANLIGNAVKFTSAGSVEVELARSNEQVIVTVSDTGTGIPPDKLSEVFEPFVQVREAGAHVPGGVGLGLAVSRRFARMLGGDLTVESELGVGSTFTLRIPELEEVPDSPAPEPESPELEGETSEPKLESPEPEGESPAPEPDSPELEGAEPEPESPAPEPEFPEPEEGD